MFTYNIYIYICINIYIYLCVFDFYLKSIVTYNISKDG